PYGSNRWPYRLLVGARPNARLNEGTLEWTVSQGNEVSVIISLGGTDKDADATLREVSASHDLFAQTTHASWNQYLNSVPLVVPSEPIKFTIATTGQQETITAEDLVRSELWFWRGLLNTTCQVPYLQ